MFKIFCDVMDSFRKKSGKMNENSMDSFINSGLNWAQS